MRPVPFILLIFAAVVLVLVLETLRENYARRSLKRRYPELFESKKSGETPEAEKKENDHG
jgi:hypothetical protein